MNIPRTIGFIALALLVLVVPAAAQLTITTDADAYSVGDVVTITINNAGPGAEFFTSDPVLAVIHLDTGDCLFGCLGLPVLTEIAAGETIVTTRNTGDLPDPVGSYRLDLFVLPGHPDSILETAYELLAPVGTDELSWDALRAFYR